MKLLKGALVVFFAALLSFFSVSAMAQEKPADKPEDYAGEFSGWGVKVPVGNYNFVKGALIVFGNRWGAAAQTAEELEEQVWEQLALSFEAFKRNIQVEDKKVEEEVSKILKEEKVSFDWQKEPEAFAAWIKERTRGTPELFKNHLRHLMQLDALRKQVLETFKPAVSEQEARDEYINEYNTIELELVQFDKLDDAQAFFKKAKTAKAWEKEVKKTLAKDPKFVKRPGFVSFEFLINMWKIPKDDLTKMLAMDIDSIYPPSPIYKGYGVFRILKKRAADPAAEFGKLRESYMKQVETIKKFDELNAWIKELKKQAGITVYPRSETQKSAPSAPSERNERRE